MVTTVACPRCGATPTSGAKYCAECGLDLSSPNLTTERTPAARASTASEAKLLQALMRATLGEYEIKGELGRGGMAIVYLAHEISLARKVALKVMLPELLTGDGLVERFKREARTAANLSHPHIIPIYWVKQTDETLFFVMKYVNGRSLDSVVREVGQLPIKMVQAIIAQVASALAHAHRKGVIHRDIKPGNIMVDDEGYAVVTDFGIAKLTEATGLTNTGSTVGTPYYMSPEQCESKAITGAADQYSLGIVAYELLTGKPPFSGATIYELMRAHFFEQAAPVQELRRDCPPRLAAMVMRMIAKKPEDRWPTLEAVIDEAEAPSMSMDDPIRSQMITLAVSGARKGVQALPVTPRSPIPERRPPRPAAARPKAPKPARVRASAVLGGLAVFGLGVGATFYGLRPDMMVRPGPSGATTGDPSSSLVSPPAQSIVADSAARAESLRALTSPAALEVPGPPPETTGTLPPRPREPVRRSTTSATTRRQPEQNLDLARRSKQQGDSSAPTPVASRAAPVVLESPATAPPEATTPAPPPEGTIRIGPPAGTEGVSLWVNGSSRGLLANLQRIRVPVGEVRLRLTKEGCESWDSTVAVTAEMTTTVGVRRPRCTE